MTQAGVRMGRIRGGAVGARPSGTRMTMGSIDRYIFRTIFGAFVLILFNLTAVIWITQILKQIDLITNQGQTILVFLRITGLLVPILMLIIAPIAIMIAICYGIDRGSRLDMRRVLVGGVMLALSFVKGARVVAVRACGLWRG